MKGILTISFCMIVLVALFLWAPDAPAFQFYSDGTNDQGGCAQCHTGFRDNNNYFSNAEGVPWNDSLHNVHLNNTTIGSNCGNCHFGAEAAGRTVNIGSSEAAADGINAIACTGCHVPEGLRAHHAVNGITLCATCHPNDPAPQPEFIAPLWYGSVINNNTGITLDPCNCSGEENLALDGLAIGLDNDGDNIYDTADPDCGCAPTGTPETVCNGIDDDFDGMIDEDYVVDDTCGIGVCGSPNNTPSSCVDGVETPCQPGPQSEPNDVTCDGLDGDCDALVDEDYVPYPETCGIGLCARTVLIQCIATPEPQCQPGAPEPEVCDNLDNDCDGLIDENLTRPTTCGVGECAGNTGTETCTAGIWGNDTCDPLAGSQPEICGDLLDSNCDGWLDASYCCLEGESRPCGRDTGECVAGVEYCVGGDWSSICVGEVGPSAEVCDNLDNDCDGAVDENLTRPTTCGFGECVGTGEETCSVGVWGNDTCVTNLPSAEVCDNLDNDCDGATDENLTRPTICGVGECGSTGQETCTAGVWGNDTCTPGTPSPEVCEGSRDEDCDGIVDEDCCCAAGETRVCGSDVGECMFGIQTCVVSDTFCGWSDCIGEVGPSVEVCDTLDNDCDGTTDEDFPNLGMMCTAGIGACEATGSYVCTADSSGTVCDAIPGTPAIEGPPGDPTCSDALDNDCDEQTDTADPDCSVLPYTMYITYGVAHTSGGFDGQGIGDIPVSGTFNMYVDNNAVTIEDIAVSDDPSSLNWNDLRGTLTGTALYLMAPSPDPAFFDTEFTGTFNGTSLSMTGTHSDPCYDCYQYDYVVQAVVATDNDGDGHAPEFGDCDDNNPLVHPGATEDCRNGIDDDCDGLTDSDDPYCTPDCFTNTDCLPDFYCEKPAGVCGGQGTCQQRPEVCTEEWNPVCGCDGITYGNSCYAAWSGVNVYYMGECTPCGGPPGVELCDNLDNDCDGLIDEDLTRPTTCGVGECAGNTGTETCIYGLWANDTCDPLAGAVPEACDGLDNDCDDMVDEDGVCAPDAIDLDIARFRASKSVKLGDEVKRIQITVENTNGGGQDLRPATLIGTQNGIEVYNKTRMVFDMSGNGRSRFAFPPFTPTATGTINWTVEIFDDDPDDDTATASTNVK